jgi:hypothetical protein
MYIEWCVVGGYIVQVDATAICGHSTGYSCKYVCFVYRRKRWVYL